MNTIAEQALARAMAKGATPVPAAAVLPPATNDPVPAVVPVEVVGHFDRLGYLEGRRHALDIVRDNTLMLSLRSGPVQIIDRLRQCMQSKPESFAMGVGDVIAMLELEQDLLQEVDRG
ncbi:hypothetical protein LJR071_003527 [Pseudomonas sp. LjRoot71]|uniref:hypothetical protein n=1 Tax=Pseudomonas sp. LjRoot71 TaxID=3342336 RepID=UPI003ECC8E96